MPNLTIPTDSNDPTTKHKHVYLNFLNYAPDAQVTMVTWGKNGEMDQEYSLFGGFANGSHPFVAGSQRLYRLRVDKTVYKHGTKMGNQWLWSYDLINGIVQGPFKKKDTLPSILVDD
jgi:hypothetical protein